MSKSIRIALIILLWTTLTLASSANAIAADTAHGHDCSTATDIALNSQTQVLLFDNTDFAVYRLVLDQRGLIDVWTDPGSFSVWDIDLLDATCRIVPGIFPATSLTTGQYSKITVPSLNILPGENVWTLPTGVYLIRLHPDPVLKQGDPFLVHVKFVAHYGHDCASAEPIPTTGTIEGALLYAQDREVFRVPINPPAKIHVWTTGPMANQPVIDLLDAGCGTVTGIDVDEESEQGIVTTTLEVGTYYLAIEPFKDDVLGPFTVHFEFLDGSKR
jgi:hypothetical protein